MLHLFRSVARARSVFDRPFSFNFDISPEKPKVTVSITRPACYSMTSKQAAVDSRCG